MQNIPTLQQLYTGILSTLEGKYSITIPVLGKVFLRAWAGLLAARLKLVYLAIGDVQKNIFVDIATPEAGGGTLERFGRVKLGRNPFPAQAGVYDVEVTGTISSVIPANTTFKSNDNSLNPGKLFVLDAAFTLASNPDIISLRALETGLDSKLSVGDGLTATAPIAGVDAAALVDAETTAPQAAEDIEDYRAKAMLAYRTETQGGAGTDYRLWSLDAQGVAQAYPYASSGNPNEIDLYIEATIADSTDGKGTAGAGILTDVEAVIEFDPDTSLPTNQRGRTPLGVFAVNVQTVAIKEIDITVNGSNLTAAEETLVTAALTEAIAAIRPFIASCDTLADKNDIIDKNEIAFVIKDIVRQAVFTSIDLEVDSTPLSTYTFDNGNIPHLNSVTYA